jgi:15-cis-phytoene synthase
VTVSEAYAEVERITRARARNFAYGIMLLPKPKRQAIAAIYAFARQVDDVADGDFPDEQKRFALEQLRDGLDAVPGGAMWVALADARARYPIPAGALSALVDGGLQDLGTPRYSTFEELEGYCKLVAGAVGVACLPVYGADDVERAETLGIALQLINILRDVREDWELGRVYLPLDELASYGVSEGDLSRARVTEPWRAFAEFHTARCRAYLAEGLRLLPQLDRRSALCVGTFAELYRETLDRIEANGYDVFGGPPKLSTLSKLRIVGQGLLR